jgi:hypothetical protein
MKLRNILKFISICLLFVLVACSEQSRIFSTSDSSFIEEELKEADKNTLVIFDINDVLLEQKELLFKKQNSTLLKNLLKEMSANMSNEEEQTLYSVVVQRPVVYVDENFVRIIHDLQNKNVKVIALTNGLVGTCGYVKSMDRLLIQQLRDLDYHLEKSWLDLKNAQIYMTKSKDRKILFAEGIVFANKMISKASKGESLLAFFKYADFYPKKVIFIDDKLKNLKSVSNILEKQGVEFIGFEYTKAKNRKDSPVITKEHAKLQLSILGS